MSPNDTLPVLSNSPAEYTSEEIARIEGSPESIPCRGDERARATYSSHCLPDYEAMAAGYASACTPDIE